MGNRQERKSVARASAEVFIIKAFSHGQVLFRDVSKSFVGFVSPDSVTMAVSMDQAVFWDSDWT